MWLLGGAAPRSPSDESMITERALQLSPAKFIRVLATGSLPQGGVATNGPRLYFFRFQIEGMSVGPSVSSSGAVVRKYLVRFIASSRPRPQSGHCCGGWWMKIHANFFSRSM